MNKGIISSLEDLDNLKVIDLPETIYPHSTSSETRRQYSRSSCCQQSTAGKNLRKGALVINLGIACSCIARFVPPGDLATMQKYTERKPWLWRFLLAPQFHNDTSGLAGFQAEIGLGFSNTLIVRSRWEEIFTEMKCPPLLPAF